ASFSSSRRFQLIAETRSISFNLSPTRTPLHVPEPTFSTLPLGCDNLRQHNIVCLRVAAVRAEEAVLGGLQLARGQSIFPGVAAPQHAVVAVLVEVPTGATAGVPHRVTEPVLQPVVVRILCCAGGCQGLGAGLVHGLDRLYDVMDLRFDHVDHRVVPQPRVGAQQEEHVRHIGYRRAPVRYWALTIPSVTEVLPVEPLDLDIPERVGHVKAGGVHDHIDLLLDAVDRDDPVPRDSRDAPGDQFRLRVGDRVVIGAGVQDPLAPDLVPRGEFAPQLTILDAATDVPFAKQLTGFQ